jgi:AraC-like DNA-binding protein
MGALVGSLVRQISAFEHAEQIAVADSLALSAMDILATAMEAEMDGGERLQQERHRRLPAVKNYILAHLHEPDLDLESIAKAQNMAPRTLNRVFASEGTTPIRWLWQQRLAASHKALSERRVDTVTDAAVACGFSDMSHFSRAFKREFGRLPHTVFAAE